MSFVFKGAEIKQVGKRRKERVKDLYARLVLLASWDRLVEAWGLYIEHVLLYAPWLSLRVLFLERWLLGHGLPAEPLFLTTEPPLS